MSIYACCLKWHGLKCNHGKSTTRICMSRKYIYIVIFGGFTKYGFFFLFFPAFMHPPHFRLNWSVCILFWNSFLLLQSSMNFSPLFMSNNWLVRLDRRKFSSFFFKKYPSISFKKVQNTKSMERKWLSTAETYHEFSYARS